MNTLHSNICKIFKEKPPPKEVAVFLCLSNSVENFF